MRMTSPFSMTLLHDLADERREFLGPPEARRKRHHFRERRLHSGGSPSPIGVWNNPGAIVITRMPCRASSRAIGSVMPDEPAFDALYAACPIWPSNAATEAVLDDHAALSFGVGRALRHRVGRKPRHVERADQVDVDRAREAGQRMRSFAADDLLAVDDARAIDESLQSPVTVERGGHRRLAARLVGDIGAQEPGAGAELLRQRPPFRFLEVGDDGVATPGHHHADRGGAQPRGTPGHDECAALELHASILRRVVVHCRKVGAVTSAAP